MLPCRPMSTESSPHHEVLTWQGRRLDFKGAYDRLSTYIETRYGLPVMISDVIDPNTGDFDGLTIQVDHDLDFDVAVFILAHLFGHTVQWAVDDDARELGTRYGVEAPPPERMEAVRQYEEIAARYALQLFREAGVGEFDQWLCDWSAADWRYLEHYYRTGHKLDIYQVLSPGTPLLDPLPIPHFTPQRWVSRFSF